MNPQQAAEYNIHATQDNSTSKLQCASLLKFESHYPPLCGIVQLTNSATSKMTSCGPIVTFRLFRLLGYCAFRIGVSQ